MSKIREFSRILKLWVTNSQSMAMTVRLAMLTVNPGPLPSTISIWKSAISVSISYIHLVQGTVDHIPYVALYLDLFHEGHDVGTEQQRAIWSPRWALRVTECMLTKPYERLGQETAVDEEEPFWQLVVYRCQYHFPTHSVEGISEVDFVAEEAAISMSCSFCTLPDAEVVSERTDAVWPACWIIETDHHHPTPFDCPFGTRRRSVEPAAMGPTPPPFLAKAPREAPRIAVAHQLREHDQPSTCWRTLLTRWWVVDRRLPYSV